MQLDRLRVHPEEQEYSAKDMGNSPIVAIGSLTKHECEVSSNAFLPHTFDGRKCVVPLRVRQKFAALSDQSLVRYLPRMDVLKRGMP